jgi:Nitroreductase
MSLFTLDTSACARDLHCVQACPKGLFTVDADGFPTPIPNADALCIDCGHCVAVCPKQALTHARLPETTFLPAQAPMAGPDEVDALIRNRRSIRRYKKQPLSDEVLEGLMDTVRYAPTASNARTIRWQVTKSYETTRKLAGLVSEWTASSGYLPQALQVFNEGGDMALRGAPHIAFFTAPEDYRWAWTDAAVAVTTLDMAATARGIGTCWAGLFIYAARAHKGLQQALNLPDGIGVFGGLMLGLPLEHYLRVPPREGNLVTWID